MVSVLVKIKNTGKRKEKVVLDNILVYGVFLDLVLVTTFKATRAQRGEFASMLSVASRVTPAECWLLLVYSNSEIMASEVVSPKLYLAYQPPFGPLWCHTKVEKGDVKYKKSKCDRFNLCESSW